MSDPSPTRRGAETDQVERMRDAYITFGFRLVRMGGDLDDAYRRMMARQTSDDESAALYTWAVETYGAAVWDDAVRGFAECLP